METNIRQSEPPTKQLGATDLFITPVGFGAWAIGGDGWEFGWGEQDDKQSVAAIHRALELGVNWIDTAAIYGMGHSEEVIAFALKTWRGTKPYIFTKCGLRWDDQGYVHRSLKAESIRRECEDSLRRLKVDVIDLYQIHWPTEDLEEGWSAMVQLQKQGKVRWIGVSNFGVNEIRRADTISRVASLQAPYSLIRREVEGEIFPYCRTNKIGVLAYSPMASGLLTGAMTRARVAALPASDWRSRDLEFYEPKLSQNLGLAEGLRKIGERHGRSPGQVAIAWVLRNPAVTGAIVGARSASQVERNVGASDLVLSEEDLAVIEDSKVIEPEEPGATNAVPPKREPCLHLR
ncbi:MAG TPA: aldo/keto reductase [Chthoniobacterales bacterium]|nr:aldo/keto reductase [Chthoniobacterales bacterium]